MKNILPRDKNKGILCQLMMKATVGFALMASHLLINYNAHQNWWYDLSALIKEDNKKYLPA